jgi:uncharacterized protein (TIGR02147 family)
MSVFKHLDYREYLQETLQAKPRQGYGEMSKWAQSCNVHPTLMSLILKGERDLSLEQAFALGQHLGHTALEQEYFIVLVQWTRAGTEEFRRYLKDKLDLARMEATKVKKRFQHESELSEEAKHLFYSSFLYSAIRLFCDTNNHGVTLEEIVERFNLDRSEILPKLEFLKQVGLIVVKGNRYKMGPSRTLIGRDSLHVIKHHQNWRMQAMQKAETLRADELMFTCPMALSKEDFAQFKQELSDMIQKFSTMLKDSKSEDVGCFILDWFWLP